MECIKYHKLEEGEEQLEIRVAYSLGCHSYLSGERCRRGYYIHFTKVKITERNGYSMKESSIFSPDNFKVMALEVKRKSAKVEELVRFFVMATSHQMHEMYMQNDRQGILDLIRENLK